jgi:hypothetical protein
LCAACFSQTVSRRTEGDFRAVFSALNSRFQETETTRPNDGFDQGLFREVPASDAVWTGRHVGKTRSDTASISAQGCSINILARHWTFIYRTSASTCRVTTMTASKVMRLPSRASIFRSSAFAAT